MSGCRLLKITASSQRFQPTSNQRPPHFGEMPLLVLRVVIRTIQLNGFSPEHRPEAEKTGGFIAVGFVVEYEGGFDGVE